MCEKACFSLPVLSSCYSHMYVELKVHSTCVVFTYCQDITGWLMLIAKSNRMRRTAREKQEQIKLLEDKIKNTCVSYKKLKIKQLK